MTDLLISRYHLCIHSSNMQRYDSTEAAAWIKSFLCHEASSIN